MFWDTEELIAPFSYLQATQSELAVLSYFLPGSDGSDLGQTMRNNLKISTPRTKVIYHCRYNFWIADQKQFWSSSVSRKDGVLGFCYAFLCITYESLSNWTLIFPHEKTFKDLTK